jgi:hypothetical protein
VRRILLSHRGRERYLELELGSDHLVGRSLEARFFLNDPSISRKHCTLRATPAGVEVEDHASRNACFVNGRRVVNRTMLADGSVLQIGAMAFSVTFLDASKTVRCEACQVEVDVTDLRGSSDGKALCTKCFESRAIAQKDVFQLAIESKGFQVLEAVSGNPPTFLVQRAGMAAKTYLVKALEMPESEPGKVTRLKEEVRALAALDHEAIAGVYDVLESDGILLLILTHEPGESLADHVARDGPLSREAALGVARTLATAIIHTHGHGILHRAVVPANIHLGENGRLRLTNFPLLRDLEEVSHSFSAAGELDRLVFFAPELIRTAPLADGRADIFGIGAVLLYALLGRSPWGKNVNVREHVTSLISGEIPEADLQGVPVELLPLLDTFLASDPERRPRTPQAALVLIEAALAAPQPPPREGVLHGAFAGREFIEFLQLVEATSKTGTAEVQGEGLAGTLVFQHGRITAARTATGLEGQPAALRLMKLQQGRFHFVAGVETSTSRGLDLTVRDLLLNVFRDSDEVDFVD